MEAVKSYRVPVESPVDLIEEYFKVKQRALSLILQRVKISKKTRLDFRKEDRKRLRDELLKDWRYSRHYVNSAINSFMGLVKGWVTPYSRRKAKNFPEITRKTVYIKNTLLIFNLSRYPCIPEDFNKIGDLILTEKELILTVKKDIELKADEWASFDVNLTNITALIDGEIKRYSLKDLYHTHRDYEIKRQRIQKLSKLKPMTSKRLLKKYSRRERDRDFMHKLTATIAGELKRARGGAILENLKNGKSRILNGSKGMNRKLSKWKTKTSQFVLEYKLKWLSLPVKYVNPKNPLKTCPLCSGSMASYEGRLMKCERCNLIMDRDVIAVLNLQTREPGSPQRALNDLIEREGLDGGENLCIST